MMDELIPQIGAMFVRASEPSRISPSQELAQKLSAFGQHPISQQKADAICERYVGIPHIAQAFHDQREVFWDRLVNASTPEEKLTCARVINALNRGIGLSRHLLGARLQRDNMERRRLEGEAEDRAAAEAAEAAAIDRWR